MIELASLSIEVLLLLATIAFLVWRLHLVHVRLAVLETQVRLTSPESGVCLNRSLGIIEALVTTGPPQPSNPRPLSSPGRENHFRSPVFPEQQDSQDDVPRLSPPPAKATPAVQQPAAPSSVEPPAPAPTPVSKPVISPTAKIARVPSGPTEDLLPQVVFSYQSKQTEFLIRLRSALNERGIITVDGTQVPGGTDWRRFYFPCLRMATVLLPILSKSFIYSDACEDELTYAVDKKKAVIPVLWSMDGYGEVMSAPERFVGECLDIESKVPKLESILNRCNRIPAEGHFEDNFQRNLETLVQAIQSAIQVGTGGPGGHRFSNAFPGRVNQEKEGAADEYQGGESVEALQQLLERGSPEAAKKASRAMSTILSNDQSRSTAVGCGVLQSLLKQLTSSQCHETRKNCCTALRNLMKTDCGSVFGGGIGGVRLLAEKEGAIPLMASLLDPASERYRSIQAEFGHGGGWNFRAQVAYVLRELALVKEHKNKVVEAGTIPLLVDMLQGEANATAKEAAGLTLRTLTAGEPRIKAAVVDAGAIGPLVQILSTGTFTGQCNASKVVMNLCDQPTEGGCSWKLQMVQAGVVPPLLALLLPPADEFSGSSHQHLESGWTNALLALEWLSRDQATKQDTLAAVESWARELLSVSDDSEAGSTTQIMFTQRHRERNAVIALGRIALEPTLRTEVVLKRVGLDFEWYFAQWQCCVNPLGRRVLLSSILCFAGEDEQSMLKTREQRLVPTTLELLADSELSSSDKEPLMLAINRLSMHSAGTALIVECQPLPQLLGWLSNGNDREKYNTAKIIGHMVMNAEQRAEQLCEELQKLGAIQVLLNMVSGGDSGQVKAAGLALSHICGASPSCEALVESLKSA